MCDRGLSRPIGNPPTFWVAGGSLLGSDTRLARLWSRDIRQRWQLIARQLTQIEEMPDGRTKKYEGRPPERADGCDCKRV